MIEKVKKTKKNEPKVFPFIVMIDKQAFSDLMDYRFSILKQFWTNQDNKLLVARKAKTQSIVGYACYLELGGPGICYLMRIAVRT